ncbi:Ribonuclease HII [Acidilobus saccharovorans 345-15]|uniref:Ribonuclease n=1 Tax=Acidilobus saccharovorans (strain DSM 16705 / JCM 18335 / VKM B-2471 / 345-15) TaxID=666510 RepID=D9Q0P7_ACIS3|nr:ribonuclease HII [Acidilobus saccharovorans]ADL18885.1 Ribonuclease HII [Acidilobus saccharovorans 345-15]
MSWIIGVDEAGRGSLVGELMLACFATKEENLGLLKDMGVRDSKQLTPHSRETLYRSIVRLGEFVVVPIPPAEIDRENVNVLEERAALKGLKVLLSRLRPELVKAIYIDKFGELRILPGELKRLGFRGRLVVEPKADANYVVVSAASIIAKVIRDRRIEVLRSMYGVEGSGYPSDPLTVSWVMKVLSSGARPPIIRYSWGTLRGTNAFVRKAKSPRRTLEDFMV